MTEKPHELLKEIIDYYEDQNFDTHVMSIDEDMNVCTWRYQVKTIHFSLKEIDEKLKLCDELEEARTRKFKLPKSWVINND